MGYKKYGKLQKWSYKQDNTIKKYRVEKQIQEALKRTTAKFPTVDTLVPVVETLVRVTQLQLPSSNLQTFLPDNTDGALDYTDNNTDDEDETDINDTIDPEFQGLLESATEKERYAALLALFYGANMSQTAFKIVVQYLNMGGSDIPQKFDHVVNRFLADNLEGKLHPTKNYVKTYQCKRCSYKTSVLSHPKQRTCLKCKDRLAMHYHFDIESQIKRIVNKNIINFNHASNSESSTISDIVDGSIYQEFLHSAQGKCVLDGNGFTFSLNTDGANPSDKSSISLWPVFLVINEIPLEERYCIENIIIAGKNINN